MRIEHGRMKWIDLAKAVSIFAVLIDHTYKILYENETIVWGTWFSTSAFIVLAGITAYYANEKYNETWGRNIYRSVKKLECSI